MNEHDKWRMIYGYAGLLLTAVLALVIAVKHVEGATSYGLDIILGGLISSQGAFSNWAFGDKGKKDSDSIN